MAKNPLTGMEEPDEPAVPGTPKATVPKAAGQLPDLTTATDTGVGSPVPPALPAAGTSAPVGGGSPVPPPVPPMSGTGSAPPPAIPAPAGLNAALAAPVGGTGSLVPPALPTISTAPTGAAIGAPAAGSPGSTFSYTDPTTGKPTQGALPGGVSGYASAPLTASGTSTTTATPTNDFAGYVGDKGGGFGAKDAAGIASIIGQPSYLSPGQVQGLSQRIIADPQLKATWEGIARNDPAAIQAAVNGNDPDLAAIGREYAQRLGVGNSAAPVQNSSSNQIAEHAWQNMVAQGGINDNPDNKARFLAQYGAQVPGGLSDTPGAPSFSEQSPASGSPIGDLSGGAISARAADAAGRPTTGTPGLSPTSAGAGGAGTSTVDTLRSLLGGGGTGTVGGGSPVPMGLPGLGVTSGVTTGSSIPGTNAAVGNLAGGVGLSPIDINNPLTAQTISRAPGADRFKIAQDQYDASVKAGEPQFQASLRDALRGAAAGGALGSGKLNTSLGDITATRQNALDAGRQGFLADALKGTIADQFGDVGVAQQQQGFQKGLSDTAFNQSATQSQLQDQLTNSDFQRNLQRFLAGTSGNPADIQLALSKIFGDQASAAGGAATNLFKTQGQTAGTSGQADYLQQLDAAIRALSGGGAGGVNQDTV